MTAAVRLRLLVAEDRPAIRGYDQDEFARRLYYDRPIAASLAAFRFARASTGEILDRLTEAQWAREGTHSESGAYSVERWLDIYAAHFASDYSTLYRNLGDLLFEDVTARARIKEPGWALVKWGAGFVDLDQDGWKDVVHANGHVYPHLRSASGKETYEQPALSVYLNARDGTFRDVSAEAGPGATKPVLGRGTAFADLDNDGDVDVVVACLDGPPVVLRNDTTGGHWLQVRAVGRRSNRDGIGARVTVRTGELTQVREVKRTLSIYSASDPRAHFGLGAATKADLVRVEWPSGKVDEWKDVPADRHYRADEAEGLTPEPPRGR
jgi:hypothetical protein